MDRLNFEASFLDLTFSRPEHIRFWPLRMLVKNSRNYFVLQQLEIPASSFNREDIQEGGTTRMIVLTLEVKYKESYYVFF